MINITKPFSQLNASSSDSNWVWQWLSRLIGDTAANTVQTTFVIIVYLVIVYIIVVQLFRVLMALNNRNSENQQERQQARDTIKSAVFILIITALVGGVGFTSIVLLMNTIVPFPNQ